MFAFNHEKLISFFVNEQIYKIIEKNDNKNKINSKKLKHFLKPLKINQRLIRRVYLLYIMIWMI